MKKDLGQRDNIAIVITILAAAASLNLWLGFLPALLGLSKAVLLVYVVLVTLGAFVAFIAWIALLFSLPFLAKSHFTETEKAENRKLVEEIAEKTISRKSMLRYALGLVLSVTILLGAFHIGWVYLFVVEAFSEIIKYLLLNRLAAAGHELQKTVTDSE